MRKPRASRDTYTGVHRTRLGTRDKFSESRKSIYCDTGTPTRRKDLTRMRITALAERHTEAARVEEYLQERRYYVGQECVRVEGHNYELL